MRKSVIITSAIATGVVLTALIATPSLAAGPRNGDAAGNATTTMAERQGAGMGSGTNSQKGAGSGMSGTKTGTCLIDVASGTVTAEQTDALAAMAAEEKLAHDLYVAFADQYDAAVFTRIASAETKHLDAVSMLLERYDIADPTIGLAAGVFSTDVTQDLYDTLLADGSVSLDAAMEAARTVEELDIADLTAAAEGVTAPDVLAVYDHLLTGSERHLVAFGG
ncbi:DUF2202 domain-containing protein [Cryobacterium melibiosiphilum]|uniref:DUF2202 domain-containing protein n=1 Tax=Cryobacterium melibiosiphilum TaxID=995039 RepID=A0A3A5MI98_9MICO|nr:DUF2202 domain-containing protein [Cryobacterium melibiosiphilum]RJT85637.1 DUF2202 domain-containing protein [Cryobacterium melibiosiphilum]